MSRAVKEPPAIDSVIERLERADRRVEEADAAVERESEESVDRARRAVRDAESLFDRYEGSATGSGRETFRRYLEFQERFASLVEDLPEDLPGREGFESANDLLDKRRLTESDFERAREALAPAREVVELATERDEAREARREARRTAERRLSELSDQVAHLERLDALAEADFEAPVDRLRDPIEAYDDAVRADFASFRSSVSARELLRWTETAASYPLVGYRAPPEDLRSYVESHAAGEESVETLLSYADESRSKLDHYVDDAAELLRVIPAHRTALRRIDAEPLTVGWPPESAELLRRRCDELISVVGRFGADETVARCRAVRDRTRRDDFERLRRAAASRADIDDLTAAERERVRSGVDDELDAARAAKERLEAALARH